MLVTGVFVDILYQIETVPSINTFLRVFIMNGFWILSNAFLNFFHLLIMIMWFFFFSQLMWWSKWKSLGHVWLYTVHGILQARKLEWPFPSPGDLHNPGIKPRSPTLEADSLPAQPQGKPKNAGVGSLSLLQGIFLTQGLNQALLHCRRIFFFTNWAMREALINVMYYTSWFLNVEQVLHI